MKLWGVLPPYRCQDDIYLTVYVNQMNRNQVIQLIPKTGLG